MAATTGSGRGGVKANVGDSVLQFEEDLKEMAMRPGVGEKGAGAIHETDDFPRIYLLGLACQRVIPCRSEQALGATRVLQAGQNERQKLPSHFRRDFIAASLYRRLGIALSDSRYRFQALEILIRNPLAGHLK